MLWLNDCIAKYRGVSQAPGHLRKLCAEKRLVIFYFECFAGGFRAAAAFGGLGA